MFARVASVLLAFSLPGLAQQQGAELLKTDLLVVLAHPDDETMMAASLAGYALGQGKAIANVYCTRGEGGGNMVGTHWGAALGVLREVELKNCLAKLGVRHCFFLDQLDWAYTESAAMTLQKWDRAATLRGLVRYVRALRPEVMLTMNPFPRPGQHGHHQSAGILAVEAFTAAADPAVFPEQMEKEGLSVWQARKLYFRGTANGPVAKIAGDTPVAEGRTANEIAGEALANHRSQGFGNFRRANTLRPPDEYALIKSVVPVSGEETDFFAGLPAPDEAVPVPPPVAEPSLFEAEFVPRPAVANFRAWADAQIIGHLVGDIASDLPVVAGQGNAITLRLINRSERAETAEIRFEAADGWACEPLAARLDIPAKGTGQVSFSVRPPAMGAKQDTAIKANVSIAGQTLRASSALHPVPLLQVPRLAKVPQLDASDVGWDNLVFTEIAATDLVQGKVENAADSSARFRLATHGGRIFVDVIVRDQTVVSNIAANDIRGHWRSDAVELCFDPVGGSEHTLGCYKIGIFPFDQTGNVRGARDADANQGPIEETAPGTRVVSARTAEGYRIQASIPLSEIGAKGDALGFNLIVYDGDKAEAATGENINESRLAWSPRSGVQGRPEDWGRIVIGE